MNLQTEAEEVLGWLEGTQVIIQPQDPEACLDWLRTERVWAPRSHAPLETVDVVRKNAFHLSSAERDAIFVALSALARSGVWHEYADMHQRVSLGEGSVHGMFRQRELGGVTGTRDAYHRFLPWHRRFLSDFEAAMRAVSPGAFIPYWDWTVEAERRLPSWIDDSRMPTSLAVRGSTSPFVVTRDVTARTPAVDSADPRLTTRNMIQTLLVNDQGVDPRTRSVVATTSYDAFTAVLERLHGAPHVWTGGTMAGYTSPGDFLFFMHHAQVDRLWRTWQARFPRERPSLSGAADRLVRVGAPAVGSESVLDVTAMGFDYDQQWH
jgi:tyrosinase